MSALAAELVVLALLPRLPLLVTLLPPAAPLPAPLATTVSVSSLLILSAGLLAPLLTGLGPTTSPLMVQGPLSLLF